MSAYRAPVTWAAIGSSRATSSPVSVLPGAAGDGRAGLGQRRAVGPARELVSRDDHARHADAEARPETRTASK